MNKNNATNTGEIKNNSIEWYVPHYIPLIPQQASISKQISRKHPTDLQYVERSVFLKEVKTQKLWSFELETQERINIPVWVLITFQQRDGQDSKNLKNDSFYRPPATSVQCIIGTENYPDSGILLNYGDDHYSQGYGKIKETFRAQTKDDSLQPYISDNDFRSSNNPNDIGHKLNVFDLRYQKNLESTQLIKVDFIFSENVPAEIYCYALVITNNMVSISSDRDVISI